FPLKSLGVRNFPVVSGMASSAPKPVPLTSDPLNSTGSDEQAANRPTVKQTMLKPNHRDTRLSTTTKPLIDNTCRFKVAGPSGQATVRQKAAPGKQSSSGRADAPADRNSCGTNAMR